MSNTPLTDALKELDHERYHMPGHKGKKPENFPDVFQIDLTEITKTGNLFTEEGPINISEKIVAKYFGAEEVIYLTGGSTQGIMTAIFSLYAKKMIIDRNSHKSVSNALALMNIEPIFVYPTILDKFYIPNKISPCDIEELILKNPDVDGVFITSPNYYGITCDVEAISNICKKYNKPLIVDEAHGCHFEAIGVKNAIKSGANIAITSAHKTTESLGQGAVLQSDGSVLNLRKNASIFGTTSPSYPIMASIEIAINNINNYKDILNPVLKLKNNIENLTKFNVLFCEDLTRFVVNTSNINLTGFELLDVLEAEFNIVCEMADYNNVVFIITPSNTKLDYLFDILLKIDEKTAYSNEKSTDFNYIKPIRKISVRDALFNKGRKLLLKDAVGKISKEIISPYPPGVPIIYPGEIILNNHIEFLKKTCYNINTDIYVFDK